MYLDHLLYNKRTIYSLTSQLEDLISGPIEIVDVTGKYSSAYVDIFDLNHLMFIDEDIQPNQVYVHRSDDNDKEYRAVAYNLKVFFPKISEDGFKFKNVTLTKSESGNVWQMQTHTCIDGHIGTVPYEALVSLIAPEDLNATLINVNDYIREKLVLVSSAFNHITGGPTVSDHPLVPPIDDKYHSFVSAMIYDSILRKLEPLPKVSSEVNRDDSGAVIYVTYLSPSSPLILDEKQVFKTLSFITNRHLSEVDLQSKAGIITNLIDASILKHVTVTDVTVRKGLAT